MKISIKIKFSVFLAILLLLTVFILSLLVLRGIQLNQKEQYEQYLDKQAETANTYFLQNVLSESIKSPESFLNSKGKEFIQQLELISGQQIVLYDMEGNTVGKKVTQNEYDNIKTTLGYALDNKIAYMIEKDSLYYLAPLKVSHEQVGVIQFYYSLTDNHRFYQQILQMFLSIGAIVFFLSFIIAYFYFNVFANGIIRLETMVNRIREGNYETSILRRRDEIGRLSKGIHGMSIQISKTIHDMEEEQKKLTLAVNKLSLLDKQQKQFIGNVTHEFKTPLTAIKAYIDLLEMYPDDDKLLEDAKMNISSETDRLYEMVEKVLQLSALDKYEFEYNKEKVDIKQMLIFVTNSMKGKMNKFGITLHINLIESYIEADKDSLMIVFVNLIDNAIKYSKANGSLTVANYLKDEKVVIDIIDTGIGIPSDLVQKVFEPFYTVDKNRARENGGAGLGLSLAQKHAKIQGGAIALVETSTEGTRFQVIFPSYPK